MAGRRWIWNRKQSKKVQDCSTTYKPHIYHKKTRTGFRLQCVVCEEEAVMSHIWSFAPSCHHPSQWSVALLSGPIVWDFFYYLFTFLYMSYFAYACKTEGKNGISRLTSALCINCLSSIPEYSRLNHLDVYLV